MEYLYKKLNKLLKFGYFRCSLERRRHFVGNLAPLLALILIFVFLISSPSCKGENSNNPTGKNKPKRIVSLAPNITEILFSLDAGDRIVGVTSFCNYPPEALSKTKIGGFTNPNLELIASLKPDLVIATPNVGNREAVLNMERVIDAEVLLFKVENIEHLNNMIEGIGAAIHEEKNAFMLSQSIHSQLQSFQKKADSMDRKKLLLSLSINPIISATSNSYPGILATIAGADLIPTLPKNQAQINSYPIVSLEEIIDLNPEVIIQTTMEPNDKAYEAELKRFWEQWSSLTAVQNHNVFVISGDLILRPSPRATDGVKLIFNLIHGESEIARGKK
jgi:iron complex transport system substrate-binding protein